MITQNKIKEVKSLGQAKYRQKYNKFIAEGSKIADQFLSVPTYELLEVYYTDEWDPAPYINNLSTISIVEKVDRKTMGRISQLRNPTEIIIVCHIPDAILDKSALEKAYSIYLDDVQNPGNVGTIIRIADWFGIKNVIRSTGSADFFNPKVVQASMGSMGKVNLFTAERNDIISLHIPLYGAAMDGHSLQEISWKEEGIIVMGHEGKGIQEAFYPHLSDTISIPGTDHRHAESLNVGIATGIICHHLLSANIIG